MNILKILSDLIKRRENMDTGRYMYGVMDEYVYYTPDGFVMYRIPENRFYLDIGKVFKDITPFNVKALWKIDEAKPGKKTGDFKIKQENKKSRTVVKFKNDSTTVWVDERLLKDFSSDCDFLLTTRFGAIYVIENGEPVDLVLPYKMEDCDYD